MCSICYSIKEPYTSKISHLIACIETGIEHHYLSQNVACIQVLLRDWTEVEEETTEVISELPLDERIFITAERAPQL